MLDRSSIASSSVAMSATPRQLRMLADHLAKRPNAPSLDGYRLVDGLRAAAALMDGLPGPIVHNDAIVGTDAWPYKIELSALVNR